MAFKGFFEQQQSMRVIPHFFSSATSSFDVLAKRFGLGKNYMITSLF